MSFGTITHTISACSNQTIIFVHFVSNYILSNWGNFHLQLLPLFQRYCIFCSGVFFIAAPCRYCVCIALQKFFCTLYSKSANADYDHVNCGQTAELTLLLSGMRNTLGYGCSALWRGGHGLLILLGKW